jgi:hypothetical protein
MTETLTFVNLIGNAIATVVRRRWERALDPVRSSETPGLRLSAPPASRRLFE